MFRNTVVSIHAPRVGCDRSDSRPRKSERSFNSRTPCGVRQLVTHATSVRYSFNSRTPCGVRRITLTGGYGRQVSIHAPRVGCDTGALTQWRSRSSFNSRTPCGVRHKGGRGSLPRLSFQFTHPVWGATHRTSHQGYRYQVSIHAPRVGCDGRSSHGQASAPSFNSRTPCGVRLYLICMHLLISLFQFTHPVWGATERLLRVGGKYVFQFTHPVWGATVTLKRKVTLKRFQFTHPVWGATCMQTRFARRY